MNIQDYLSSLLSKQKGAYSKAFTGSGTVPTVLQILDGVDGWQSVPMLQSQFALQIDLPGMGDKFMLLKKFTFPEVGITFDFSTENMWYPTPKISVNTLQIEGYMFYGDLDSSIYALYNKQFKNGLLNIQGVCPSITLSQIKIFEDFDATVEELGTATAALKALIAAFTGGIAGAAVSAATDVYDVVQDVKIQTHLKADKGTGEFQVNPLITFNRCNFSAPVINPDPSNNNFVSVTINVSYRSFTTEDKSIK